MVTCLINTKKYYSAAVNTIKKYQPRICNGKNGRREKNFIYMNSQWNFSIFEDLVRVFFRVTLFQIVPRRVPFVSPMKCSHFPWVLPSVRDVSHFSRVKHSLRKKWRRMAAQYMYCLITIYNSSKSSFSIIDRNNKIK